MNKCECGNLFSLSCIDKKCATCCDDKECKAITHYPGRIKYKKPIGKKPKILNTIALVENQEDDYNEYMEYEQNMIDDIKDDVYNILPNVLADIVMKYTDNRPICEICNNKTMYTCVCDDCKINICENCEYIKYSGSWSFKYCLDCYIKGSNKCSLCNKYTGYGKSYQIIDDKIKEVETEKYNHTYKCDDCRYIFCSNCIDNVYKHSECDRKNCYYCKFGNCYDVRLENTYCYPCFQNNSDECSICKKHGYFKRDRVYRCSMCEEPYCNDCIRFKKIYSKCKTKDCIYCKKGYCHNKELRARYCPYCYEQRKKI